MMRVSVACLSLALAVPANAADAPPEATLVAGPLAVSGSFDFATKAKKTRRSVSGAACMGEGRCLIVFDEGFEARFADLTKTGYVADPAPVAIGTAGEVDAEAAAFDGRHLYVLGSHAMKRNTCDPAAPNLASRVIVRLDPDGGGRVAGDLTPAIEATPALAAALGRCLADGQGLDFEGMFAAGGRLYLGLRGPAANGATGILSVDAKALFVSPPGASNAAFHPLQLSGNRAIRDMAAVAGGALILAGPDDVAAHADQASEIMFWRIGEPTAKPLATLPADMPRRAKMDGCKDEDFKPETLAAASETAQGYSVVVLYDGMCDGAPTWFDLPRAAP